MKPAHPLRLRCVGRCNGLFGYLYPLKCTLKRSGLTPSVSKPTVGLDVRAAGFNLALEDAEMNPL